MEPQHFTDAAAWRAWLERNSQADEVWVRFFKKSSKQTGVSYEEAVYEALCFGWIDGLKKAFDSESYMHRFTPRKTRSRWTPLNEKRVLELITRGKMKPAGLRAYELRVPVLAQAKELSPGHQRIFHRNKDAWQKHQHLPPSYQRMTAAWVGSAKRPETQHKRLTQLIDYSARNERIKFM